MYKERLVVNKNGEFMIRGFDKTECYCRYLGFWDYFFYAPQIAALNIIDILS